MSTLDDDDKELYEGPHYACERACRRAFWRVMIPIAIIFALASLFIRYS